MRQFFFFHLSLQHIGLGRRVGNTSAGDQWQRQWVRQPLSFAQKKPGEKSKTVLSFIHHS